CPGASGGECGSAAGGSKREHELDGPGHGSGSGEKNDNAPGLSEGEADLVRHQIAATIQSSARGDIPDYMKRWAKEILEPRIDWRKALRALIKHSLAEVAGQVDYTWRKRSRRQGAYPRVLIPAMFAPVPRVSVVVDTSGSMGDETLDRCLA